MLLIRSDQGKDAGSQEQREPAKETSNEVAICDVGRPLARTAIISRLTLSRRKTQQPPLPPPPPAPPIQVTVNFEKDNICPGI